MRKESFSLLTQLNKVVKFFTSKHEIRAIYGVS